MKVLIGVDPHKVSVAVAVVVSESSTVRMFDDGELVAEIVPELWLLGGYGSYLDGSSMGRESRRTTL